ncbi:MAG: NINE protein [Acholeplasmataceae bacterium]
MKKYCSNCGFQVQETDKTCSYCGETLVVEATFDQTYRSNRNETNGLVLLLIFIFLPGVHYFLVRRFISGVLFLATFGGFGIWWVIDLVMIVTSNFKDSDGETIKLS